MATHTFTFSSDKGAVLITADLNNGIWDNIRVRDNIEPLPDHQYLMDLLTYAVLEGPELNKGDTLALDLDSEYCSWTWQGDAFGDVLDCIVFTAN